MIEYLIMDVDGTLTDGKIYMSTAGEFCKAFNIKDGYGISTILRQKEIVPIIITGRESEIVIKRCQELGIQEIYQGISDKLAKLKEITENLEKVAFIGDDMNDFECMKQIKESGGIIGCPADAVKEVKKIADFASDKNGGEGAVRDFIEWILKQREEGE